MPIREFECKKCGHVFEEILFRSDMSPPSECPECGEKGPEMIDISASNAQFKGAGWASDGYSSSNWAKKDSGLVRVGNPKKL